METLLHYVWKHRLYNHIGLQTDEGASLEVIDPGLHNVHGVGPDFFNAKLCINGVLWAGNVELHDRASDWFRHKHADDSAYNNVILHVVGEIDAEARTHNGKRLPQLELSVPQWLLAKYKTLIAEEDYPPCHRVIKQVPEIAIHAWLNRLTVERLEEKMLRVERYQQQNNGDWERTFFITLARNFGFGFNAQTFELWARTVDLSAVGKHRDDLFQVEAFFMGQAGFLTSDQVPLERRDDYYLRLQNEYRFLQHKFGLEPIDVSLWKFGRLRPQNFPYTRLSQLAAFYTQRRANFSQLLEMENVKQLRSYFKIGVTPYWRSHYAFGEVSAPSDKVLRADSLNLLIINSAVPLLFAYARERKDEDLSARAYGLLEALPPEHNHITRCWEQVGICAAHAADSQALIRLHAHYCDRKDCLRCRFGQAYLKKINEITDE